MTFELKQEWVASKHAWESKMGLGMPTAFKIQVHTRDKKWLVCNVFGDSPKDVKATAAMIVEAHNKGEAEVERLRGEIANMARHGGPAPQLINLRQAAQTAVNAWKNNTGVEPSVSLLARSMDELEEMLK